jgi:hypothetical protein
MFNKKVTPQNFFENFLNLQWINIALKAFKGAVHIQKIDGISVKKITLYLQHEKLWDVP